MKQAQVDAEQAKKDQAAAQAKIKNQEAYQSLISNIKERDVIPFVASYDPNKDYTNASVQHGVSKAARSAFEKQKKSDAQAQEQAVVEEAQKIAPIPTEYAAGSAEASLGVRRKESRRRGLAASVFAGETGGYNTAKKTLLG